jgi:hypothetical protein
VRKAPGEWADTVGGTGGPNTHIPQALGRWLDLCRWDRSILADAKLAFDGVGEDPPSCAVLLGVAELAKWQRETTTHTRVTSREE